MNRFLSSVFAFGMFAASPPACRRATAPPVSDTCRQILDDAARACDPKNTDRRPSRLVGLGYGGDTSCLTCGKTWVSCELADEDVAKVKAMIAARDPRPIRYLVRVRGNPREKPARSGVLEVRTGAGCAEATPDLRSHELRYGTTGWTLSAPR